MTDSIKAQEQAHLDRVVDKIEGAERAAEKKIRGAKKDIHSLAGGFDDIRMNTGTYSGMMDTAVSVRAQQQMLDERENSWQHAADQLATLKRLKARPYFARIDFTEQAGQAEPETIYIGLASFADRPDHFLVYDWRAPISSIYYEGELGPVTYATPDGNQTVDVKLKRQFQIEKGVIVTLYDTAETVTDQMLLAALNNHSSTKMKSIVTTIQRTQNQIIRNTSADLLFVQGAAGSGKTATVLQRVAWLLYRYRGNLTASQVVLFSPNQLFNDYIDQVLPELGEHNMVQMTYYQFVNRRVPRLQVANIRQRFEAGEDPLNQKATRLLTSLDYFRAVTRYAKRLGSDDHLRIKSINFRGRPFFAKEKIKDLYYSFNQNYNLGNRLDATKQELVKQLNRRIGGEMRAKWVEERIQTMSKEELDVLYHQHGGEFADEAAETKFLARRVVMEAFRPLKRAIDHNRWLNINLQYRHLLRVTPKLVNLAAYDLTEEEWATYLERQLNAFKDHQLSGPGVSIYLYLYDLLTGKRGQREIRYVFVDEVQDYDAFQLAYLKYCFPKARFTLLGDLNQAIFTHHQGNRLLKQLGTMFDPAKTQVVQLTKSYRSTAQITDFTKAILKDGEAIEAFDRQGPLPKVLTASTIDQAADQVVTALREERTGNDTTAVIAKDLTDANQIYALLRERGQKATLIQTENQRLVPGTIVVPSYLAKGLEFDAVVVWDANQEKYHGDGDRQLVYTICSRAMHHLTITAVGQETSLIGELPKGLFTRG